MPATRRRSRTISNCWPKYAGDAARSRGSSPNLQVLNTALMTVIAGASPEEAQSDREFRGRLVESAVGAHLANAAAAGEWDLFYWRDRGQGVDFVVKTGARLTAIGGDGISVEPFLQRPVEAWLAS